MNVPSGHQPQPWARRWRDHILIIGGYLLLSCALSWPLLRDFSTMLVSDGLDARHNLWGFWHVQQVLLGRQPPFSAPLLYYPHGITLLVHGVGPLSGLFALPFWPLGPAAAYNGALLVALTLSGYGTYLLARDLGFPRAVAAFSGLMVLTSPTAIVGLESHITKVFLGAIPLALLVVLRALDPDRSRRWAVWVGPALLVVLLHNGYQFVFTALAVGLFSLAALWRAPRAQRGALTLRVLLMAASALLTVGPLLAAIVSASATPGITVDVNADSLAAPDLLQFLLPPSHSLFFGQLTADALAAAGPAPASAIESAVSLSLAGLALAACAWPAGGRARTWLALTGACALFALGPSLRIAGQTMFTEYELPIILPYAWLTGLPGLEFMRAPGRFMMLGFVAFAITAGFGLSWLWGRFPRRRSLLTLLATALLLVETWPAPRLQEALDPVPGFYRQLASDPAVYGVFDLPLKPAASMGWNTTTIFFSSYYQIFQMIHGKGIVGGYISRSYQPHPVFPDLLNDTLPPLFVDGQPAAYQNFQHDLAGAGYRFVVLHKQLFPSRPAVTPGGLALAEDLLAVAFAQHKPLLEDAQIRVYRVRPDAEVVQARWGAGWSFVEPDFRWAASPATLQITAPTAQPALLELTPALIYDPAAPNGLGAAGTLLVEHAGAPPIRIALQVDQPTTVPIALQAGSQTITLTLHAGNFTVGSGESRRRISVAMRRINLRTAATISPPLDLVGADLSGGQALLGWYGAGWYPYEVEGAGRWSASPSEIWLYSPEQRSVGLSLIFDTLYNGTDLGPYGRLWVEDAASPTRALVITDRAAPPLIIPLIPGWNRLRLRLDAGSFQPNQLFPGSTDQRRLSFRIRQIQLTPP